MLSLFGSWWIDVSSQRTFSCLYFEDIKLQTFSASPSAKEHFQNLKCCWGIKEMPSDWLELPSVSKSIPYMYWSSLKLTVRTRKSMVGRWHFLLGWHMFRDFIWVLREGITMPNGNWIVMNPMVERINTQIYLSLWWRDTPFLATQTPPPIPKNQRSTGTSMRDSVMEYILQSHLESSCERKINFQHQPTHNPVVFQSSLLTMIFFKYSHTSSIEN